MSLISLIIYAERSRSAVSFLSSSLLPAAKEMDAIAIEAKNFLVNE